MTKRKKTYCTISLLAGMLFLIAAFAIGFGTTAVYAVGENPVVGGQPIEGLTDPNTTSTIDARTDSTNGLSIIYNGDEVTASTEVKTLLMLTILALAPSLLIMLTSYTRIIVVLHFIRTAVGTQTSPPNQVIVGLALFLTFFIMWPTLTEINETAIQPLDAGEITIEEAFETAQGPIRTFMMGQVQEKDLKLFMDMDPREAVYEDYDEVPMTIVIPAFIISELRYAFIIGFVIYIPFIVIDMVVASVLMSMGMMMLPPTTISLPFKILLFVLADGWNLVLGSLVRTFL